MTNKYASYNPFSVIESLQMERDALLDRIEQLHTALGEIGFDWCQHHCDGDDHTDSCKKAHAVWMSNMKKDD